MYCIFRTIKSLWSIKRISQKMRHQEEKNMYKSPDYKSHLFRNVFHKIQDQGQTFNLGRQVTQ